MGEHFERQLRETKKRMTDEHAASFAKREARLKGEVEEKVSGLRSMVEGTLAPTEERKAHTDAIARVKQEEERLAAAITRLKSLGGKPLPRPKVKTSSAAPASKKAKAEKAEKAEK